MDKIIIILILLITLYLYINWSNPDSQPNQGEIQELDYFYD